MQQAMGRQLARLLHERVAAIEHAVAAVPERLLFVPVAPGTRSLGGQAVRVARGLAALASRVGAAAGANEVGAEPDLRETVLPRQEVLARLREAAQAARGVLLGLDAAAWAAAPGAPEDDTPGARAQRALDELSFYAGQIELIGTILRLLEQERER